MTVTVAPDGRGIVEVVPGVHADAVGEAAPQLDLASHVEQGDLDAVDLRRVFRDHGDERVGGFVEVVGSPVAGERGIEHVTQPVHNRRVGDLPEDLGVGLVVVIGTLGGRGEMTAGHYHGLPAVALDEIDLLVVGIHDLLRRRRALRQLVGVGTAGDVPALRLCLGHRADDQLAGGRPVETHAALGGVHGVGHRQAPRPEMAADGQGGVPVHAGFRPRGVLGERIGDDMGRGEDTTALQGVGWTPEVGGLTEGMPDQGSVLEGDRQ